MVRHSHGAGTDSSKLAGIRALVVGLGREGIALTGFLAGHGAQVTVTDVRPAGALADALATLADLPVNQALGGHPVELLDDTDVILVSPGVPPDISLLVEARRRNIPLGSETRLFTRLCPAPIVGITGSSGKTTTTALVGEMLRAAGRQVWVGGNIGRPLISCLDEIDPRDTVVMELSSFQLEFFRPWSSTAGGERQGELANALFDPSGWSPAIAAILNITPNHLDRHATMDRYVAAKAQIVKHQEANDVTVLNRDDSIVRKMGRDTERTRRVSWFSLESPVGRGAYLEGDALAVCHGKQKEIVCKTTELKLLGRHNTANVLAACALASAAGALLSAQRQAATTFAGVEHRLQLVRERAGVRWYDDSIATAPERTVAALLTFPTDELVLLAGGRDKHLPWQDLADLAWKQVRHLILFGEAMDLIERAMQESEYSALDSCRIYRAGTLEGAVQVAAEVSLRGDVVLLSPGGTSFDAYTNFVERGLHFQQLVKSLE